jgi:hypothetical protein
MHKAKMFSDRINWIDLIYFHGFHLPAIASSSEAGGDEAEKTQFRVSGKKNRGAHNGCFPPIFTVLSAQ